MASKIKVDNINKVSDDSNIINKCGTTITVGASGDNIALASGATQTGFGKEGAVNWQTGSIKTTTFTAVSGEGYFCNTSGGAFTATLPSSPSAGDIVALKDYAQTFATFNLTVGRNGSNIESVAANITLDGNSESLTLVYVDATKGWLVVGESTTVYGQKFVAATGGDCTATVGNYKIHTFTSPGTLCVSCAGNAAGSNTLDYLVVAGGGGGSNNSGGGGGGGFRESVPNPAAWTASPLAEPGGGLTAAVQGYPICVGGAGTAGVHPGTRVGGRGGSSTFDTITSTGGGGGNQYGSSCVGPAIPGGSGGGGNVYGGPSQPIGTAGGTGNTPPVSPPQGNNGGQGGKDAGPSYPSGGGGGAGGVGTAGGTSAVPNTTPGGPGGAGVTTEITNSPLAFSGGGGGGGWGNNPGGTASSGGGCAGNAPSRPGTYTGENGTTNRGGGGGGSTSPDESNYVSPAGAGGSGIVVIRYKFQ